jgi:hypothetical protein
MTLPGRTPLSPGALREPRRSRSATSAIGTTVVAILGVLVVVLSYRAGHQESTASLAGQIAGLRYSVQTLAKKGGAAPAKTKSDRQLGVCMNQVQREIDDLQSSSHTAHHRDATASPAPAARCSSHASPADERRHADSQPLEPLVIRREQVLEGNADACLTAARQ